MAREIERKFLVRSDAWRRDEPASLAIRQFYLAFDNAVSVRVRVVDDARAFLTLKTGTGLNRGEFEYEIPLADARDLEAARRGATIEKRRHKVPHGRHTIEVDVFGGALAPLVVAEIELAAENEAVDLPAYLGREVTGDPAYSNARLALSGERPDPSS